METPIIPFDQSPIQLSLNSSDLLSIPYGVMNVKKKIKKIQEMFQGWFSNSESNYNAFIQAMLRGNVKEMNTYMNEVALATFNSFDTGRHPSRKSQPERFYQGFVLGLLVELRDRYEVKSNRESGYGRYDVMLISRETPDQAIIKKEEATSKSLLPFFVCALRRTFLMGESPQSALVVGRIQPRPRVSIARWNLEEGGGKSLV